MCPSSSQPTETPVTMRHPSYQPLSVNDETDESEVTNVLHDHEDTDCASSAETTYFDTESVQDDGRSCPSATVTVNDNEDSQPSFPLTTDVQRQVQRWLGNIGPESLTNVFVDGEAIATEYLQNSNTYTESNLSYADTNVSLAEDNKAASEQSEAANGSVQSDTVNPTPEDDVPINNALSSLDGSSNPDIEAPWPRPPVSPPPTPPPGPQPAPQPDTAESQSAASPSSDTTPQDLEDDNDSATGTRSSESISETNPPGPQPAPQSDTAESRSVTSPSSDTTIAVFEDDNQTHIPQPHTTGSQSRSSSSSGATIFVPEEGFPNNEGRLYLQPPGSENIETHSLPLGDENDIELANLSASQDLATDILCSGPISETDSPALQPAPQPDTAENRSVTSPSSDTTIAVLEDDNQTHIPQPHTTGSQSRSSSSSGATIYVPEEGFPNNEGRLYLQPPGSENIETHSLPLGDENDIELASLSASQDSATVIQSSEPISETNPLGPQPAPQPDTAESQSRLSSSSGATIYVPEEGFPHNERRLYLQPPGSENIETHSLPLRDENDIELASLSASQDSATSTQSSGSISEMDPPSATDYLPSQEPVESNMGSPPGPQETSETTLPASNPTTSIDPKHSWANRKAPYYESLPMSLDSPGYGEDPEVAPAAPLGEEARNVRREKSVRFGTRVLHGICR
ncbi:hypothetical protein BZA77DRAFT_290724 [Pyronema omphalodes]|nr:hypothetical protein BZA77DRAFT_290724 [Pyronema omphalodes]